MQVKTSHCGPQNNSLIACLKKPAQGPPGSCRMPDLDYGLSTSISNGNGSVAVKALCQRRGDGVIALRGSIPTDMQAPV